MYTQKYLHHKIAATIVLLLTPFVGYSADVFDEELANLLAKPVVTTKTLPDGSVISTISVGGSTSNSTSAGYITLPS